VSAAGTKSPPRSKKGRPNELDKTGWCSFNSLRMNFSILGGASVSLVVIACAGCDPGLEGYSSGGPDAATDGDARSSGGSSSGTGGTSGSSGVDPTPGSSGTSGSPDCAAQGAACGAKSCCLTLYCSAAAGATCAACLLKGATPEGGKASSCCSGKINPTTDKCDD
jgi:hypothetical protein